MLNEVVHNDCIDVMNEMDAETARLIVADPPYFNVLLNEAWDTLWKDEKEYLSWTANWMRAAMRVLMPGGLLYCFGQVGKREHVMLHLMSNAVRNYAFHDLIIWDRTVGYNERSDSFTPAYEMILVIRKEGEAPLFNKDVIREPYDTKTIALYLKDKRYKDPEARRQHLEKGKYATNLWRIPSLKGASKEKTGHPSQKPLTLVERIILSSSNEGDLVIDPFLGSGTTAVAAQKHGRNWIGIEQDEDYVEMARKRLAEFVEFAIE